MHYYVEIVFDEVHAKNPQEAAQIAHRQIVEGALTTMRVTSEDGTDTEVSVEGDGAAIAG